MSTARFGILASFRDRSYSDDDVASLRAALSEVGRVAAEPLALPEAGGTWELWIDAKAIVEGIEAAIVYDVLKSLMSHAVRWIRSRRRPGSFEPELHAVQVSTENVRVAVRTSEGDMAMDLATAERIANLLPGEFPQDLVASRDIRVIIVEIAPEGVSDGPRWLVGLGSESLTHEYDPKRRRFTVMSERDA